MMGTRNSVVSQLKDKQLYIYIFCTVFAMYPTHMGDAVPCIPSYVINLSGSISGGPSQF